MSIRFNPLSYSSYIYEIQFHKYITKVVRPNIFNKKPIKLISGEYFVSPLRDYEFHLENICSINTKCGQQTEVLIVTLDFTPDISKIKATYTS